MFFSGKKFQNDRDGQGGEQLHVCSCIAHMTRTKAVPAVKKLYRTRAIWQDDTVTIHRTADVLEACSAFSKRIPHELQAPKSGRYLAHLKCVVNHEDRGHWERAWV